MDKPKNKGGRPKGSYELANFIRASARRAMEQSEKEGKSLADLLKAELQAKPLEFVRAMASYTPREIDFTDDREVSELTEAELDERITRLAARIEARLERAGELEAGESANQASAGASSKLH